MNITGIICEYNPLHIGHKKQIDLIRKQNPDGCIVCLMSGNFVQRGSPALFNKMLRAEAAIRSGADLVLEMPVLGALSSAEGFAATGVSVLSPVCNNLCFGAETAETDLLWSIANALVSEEFPPVLKKYLEQGLSFPAARQQALGEMSIDASCLSLPNNILAVEYCKAILTQNSSMDILPILRKGNYHSSLPEKENPSATSLRGLILSGADISQYIPHEVLSTFQGAIPHATEFAEKSILSRLRTMADAEFEALPYGSEGLWRKLLHACREQATLEEIIAATKSKRYTRTRLDRMVLCAFLGITKDMLNIPAPYVRALGFNDRGREILKLFRETGDFPNIGQTMNNPYQLLENRCTDLYGLFAKKPESPGKEEQYRVYYHKNA